LFLDPQQLIVLRQPFAAGHGADLDLARAGGDREIGDVVSSVSPLRAEITGR